MQVSQGAFSFCYGPLGFCAGEADTCAIDALLFWLVLVRTGVPDDCQGVPVPRAHAQGRYYLCSVVYVVGQLSLNQPRLFVRFLFGDGGSAVYEPEMPTQWPRTLLHDSTPSCSQQKSKGPVLFVQPSRFIRLCAGWVKEPGCQSRPS